MKRFRFLLFLPALLVFVGCGGGGGGGTSPAVAIFVDAVNGSDVTGDGTQANPYRTFTKALTDPDLAQVLQIRAAAGAYNGAAGETFPLTIPAGVVMRGTGNNPSDVSIEGGAADAVLVILGSGAEMDNVAVTSNANVASAAVRMNDGTSTAHTTITDCEITGGGANGRNAVEINDSGAFATIENSMLAATDGICVSVSAANVTADLTGNTMGSAYGVFLTSSANGTVATLRGNTISNATTAGVNVEGGSVDAGTDASAGANIFTGNTVHLRDGRGTGTVMFAKGNNFNPAAECGVNIIATPGSGGWDTGDVCESAVYVDAQNGNDTTNPGTQAAPYQTITKALTDSRVPTLPILITGNFSTVTNETFPIVLDRAGTTILGSGSLPTDVIVTGDPSVETVIDIQADGCTLQNFRAVSSYNAGSGARVVRVSGDNATFDTMNVASAGSGAAPPNGVEADQAGISMTFTGCTMTAPSSFCILLNADVTATITSCNFTNCASGVVLSGPGTAVSATVRDCSFQATTGEAILVVKGSADVGTDGDPGGNTFDHCQIDLNDARTSGAQMFAIDNVFSADPPVCGDNIFVGGAGGWSWRVTGGSSGTCP